MSESSGSGFSVNLTFSSGWCSLGLANNNDRAQIKNHWVNNRLDSLAGAVLAIIDGCECSSVRWQRELAGGHFIDMVRNRQSVSVVVHEFYFGNEAHSAEQIYSARRGLVIFAASVPIEELATSFAAEFRRVRYRCVDRMGMIDQWSATFPESLFASIERGAKNFGYRPALTEELRSEAD